jgi:hypothetical protein
MELITTHSRKRPFGDKRRSTRQALVVPARLSWKDQRGTTRFANVVTRDISDEGIYVDWQGPSAIPLYRLVQFQVVSEARRAENLPAPLRTGKVLSAVFRIGQRRRTTGAPEGYALRLLVAPAASEAESSGVDEDLVSATA